MKEMLKRCQTYTDSADLAARDVCFPTGERCDAVVRFLRTADRWIEPADHLGATWQIARYEFATRLTNKRHVVDCACGAGYGSRIMFYQGASSVLGIEIDAATIDYATKYYGNPPHVQFICADAISIADLAPAETDCVVSLETIEHLHQPDLFLSQVRDILAPNDGMLIISSPPPHKAPENNPYHVREWELEEFSSHLRQYFTDITFFVQITGLRFPFRKLSRILGISSYWMGDTGGIRPLDEVRTWQKIIGRLNTYIAVAKGTRH